MHIEGTGPVENYRSTFASQVISDASMAHLFDTLLNEGSDNDKFMFIIGVSRMSYGYGIPQRIYRLNPQKVRG
jgi:uncharacterized iron-regulated protein